MGSFFKSLANDVLGAMRQAAGSTVGAEVPTSAKIVKDDVIPGDINIYDITIFNTDKGVYHDLKAQVTEIHIFENITSPVIFAHLQVVDGIDLDKFPIDSNNTYVYLEFRTPGATIPSMKHVLKVNKQSDKRPNVSNGVKTFSLQLVSPEATTTNDIKYDLQGFKLNDSPKELIEKIVKDKIESHPTISSLRAAYPKTNKAHHFENASGIIAPHKYMVKALPQNTKPFQGIHQIVLLTPLTPESHGLHVFFENRHGYFFTTVEKMMIDGKKLLEQDKSDAIFFFDNQRNENHTAVKIRNIIAYNQLNTNDAASATSLGINSEVTMYNPQTGEWVKKTQTPETQTNRGDWTRAEALREYDAVTRQDVVSSTEQKRLHETMERRKNMLLRIESYEAQIMIYGDTNIAAGDVIECKFPRNISLDKDALPNGDNTSMDSGKYLITHLRHIILNSNRPQHVMSCNLVKAEVPRS